MRKNKQPIGIFDSGLGGLTVVKQIMRILPHENILYLGDTARVPYGPRSPETIRKFSEENTEFLLGKKVKCIVIACNTSSAVAADHLKRKYGQTPIFEVIGPAAKEAVKAGQTIGVIGTRATIGSRAYTKAIGKLSKLARVYDKACPLFVPFIEEGESKGEALKLVAKAYLSELKIKKIDILIMGCTHYPIIEGLIKKEVDNNVKIIDPGISVAKEILEFLTSEGILNPQKVKGKKRFFVTDLPSRFVTIAEMFLDHKVSGSIQKVNLQK